MRKATALLVVALGTLSLVGAGCSNTEEQVNNKEENVSTEATSTPKNETASEENQEITATAEVLENGVVSVKWNVPENFDKTKSFQVLHSSKPNPNHPTAFWFQYMNNIRSTELSNVATGTRYIRVCSFDLDKKECVKFSNEIQVEVK